MSTILLKILALIYVIYVIYIAILDYKYREMKRRIILFAYPFVFYMNWVVCEFRLLLVFSSLILFVTLYCCALIKPNSFGTIDILASPLYTIWFNEYAIFYSLALILLNSASWNFGIVRLLFSKKGERLTNPFLVIMTVVFLLSLFLFPNNFIKIL